MSTSWLTEVSGLCNRARLQHVDVLVDQAGWDMSVLPALQVITPSAQWYSLFSDTPEHHLLQQAPILMRLRLDEPQHLAWLEEILRELGATPRLMILLSPLAFDVLAAKLRGLSRLEWGGRTGLLRYFDTRIFARLLSTVLSEEQRVLFLQTGFFWGWVDRDGQMAWLSAEHSTQALQSAPATSIVLTDAQFQHLGDIEEAENLLPALSALLQQLSLEACFLRCHEWVLRAGQEQYFGCLRAYLAKHFIAEPD